MLKLLPLWYYSLGGWEHQAEGNDWEMIPVFFYRYFDTIVEIVILIWEKGGCGLEPKVYLSVSHGICVSSHNQGVIFCL